MTKQTIANWLQHKVCDFAIDPHDAENIYADVPAEGLDAETFGDILDGQGYPELASDVYPR